MTIPSISPEQAQALLADGALLVDIRNHDEHAREHIPGAMPWPVSQPTASLSTGSAKTVIFHCRSGVRTQANAATLAAAAGCEAFLMSGGLDAWKRAGLPVRQDRRQPIELMPADVYYITGLPTELNASDVGWIALVALVMSFLATLYPARRAARTAPAEALRYE